MAGHHNIAWQLSGDRRFQPELGTIEDLLREIGKSDHDVILSSEDFECAATTIASFVDTLKQSAFDATIVLYLRNQVSYVRSLYLTLLELGYTETFDDVISDVLEDRVLRWKEWIFGFCYRDLVRQLPSAATVVVRPFEHTKPVLSDFASILNCNLADLGIDVNLRINEQRPFSAAFVRFYGNRMGRQLNAEGRSIARTFDDANVDMRRSTKQRMMTAFDKSNRWIESHYGITLRDEVKAKAAEYASEPAARLSIESIFTANAIRLIDESMDLPAMPPDIRAARIVDALRDQDA